MDRITSRITHGSASAELLDRYLVERDVFTRIASLRASAWDAIEQVAGEHAVEEYAELVRPFPDR